MLGLHEDFTLYATMALTNMLEEPEVELWALAQKVDGWGKIHLVERLASSTLPQIKDWLLRQGYRNSIMYEYLAYACAVGGNLKEALAAGNVDDELLEAAGEIIKALINGGPAQSINSYEDAAETVSRYLTHLETRALKLEQLLVAHSIRSYLTGLEEDGEAEQKNGWNEQLRMAALAKTAQILRAPHWPGLVEAGLEAQESQLFYLASRAAAILGIDTWDKHWARLQADPLDNYHWQEVMRRATTGTIDLIVSFALERLPLYQVATGAADEFGLGPQYKAHQCLGMIVQYLGNYPTKGWRLILTCLQSPVVGNRNLAIRTLAQWGRHHWTQEIEAALGQAQEVEPRDDIRERIRKLLTGEPLG